MVGPEQVESNFSQEQLVRALLEKINAYIEQFHGGSVQMVSLEGRVLKVRLGGACLGCPLSPTTLHGWVAGTVHQFFPDLEVVDAGS
jgi:Fe-S cluster biogenesis protein NfuA